MVTAFWFLSGRTQGPVEFGDVLGAAIVIVRGRREGAPPCTEDPESCEPVREVGMVVLAVRWYAQDRQARTLSLRKLCLGRVRIEEVCRSVAEPHFFESASVSRVGGPAPGQPS